MEFVRRGDSTIDLVRTLKKNYTADGMEEGFMARASEFLTQIEDKYHVISRQVAAAAITTAIHIASLSGKKTNS